MPFYAIDGVRPVAHPSSFIHPTASIIGDVIIGANCYIGPGASLRGDFGRMIIEDGANIQDTCVLHSFPKAECRVERNGHIGHGAVLHGCIVGEAALVGMNAVLMDGVVVGESAIVAAMSFVKAGFEIPPRCLAAGAPVRILRELKEQELEWKKTGTEDYQELTRRSLAGMVETTPLPEIEDDRPQLKLAEAVPLYQLKQGQREG